MEILLDYFGPLPLIRDVRTAFSAGVLGEGIFGDRVDVAQLAEESSQPGCGHAPQPHHAHGDHVLRRKN